MNSEELLTIIKTENYTYYLEVLKKADDESTAYGGLGKFLTSLTDNDLNNLTVSQLTLLKAMRFKGGSGKYYNTTYHACPISYAMKKIPTIALLNITKLPKEDLIFFSNYYKNIWRKANSVSNNKFNKYKVNMDTFSLSVFKNNITKPFLRTEAKVLVQKVNEAFLKTTHTTEDVHIRNKFYAIILDNTPVHTKAMLTLLMPTHITTEDMVTYDLHADEAICISRGSSQILAAITTPDSIETYSSDIPNCSHAHLIENNRVNQRRLTDASALMTAYTLTNNINYKILADKMLKSIPASMHDLIISKANSVKEIQNTLNTLN